MCLKTSLLRGTRVHHKHPGSNRTGSPSQAQQIQSPQPTKMLPDQLSINSTTTLCGSVSPATSRSCQGWPDGLSGVGIWA